MPSVFYVGSVNGVQVQGWTTWLLYAVLTDLCDDIATTLNVPFACISFEMVYLKWCIGAGTISPKPIGAAKPPIRLPICVRQKTRIWASLNAAERDNRPKSWS